MLLLNGERDGERGGGKRWGEVGGLLLKRRRERQKEGRSSLVSQKRDG